MQAYLPEKSLVYMIEETRVGGRARGPKEAFPSTTTEQQRLFWDVVNTLESPLFPWVL